MKKRPDHEPEFDDIRPYRDWEIRDVLNRIRQHPWILSALRRFYWPKMPAWLVKPVEWMIKVYLRLRLIPIHTVDDWHYKYFRKTVLQWIEERTMSGLTYSGLEEIDRERGSLFVTNHRDIVLDSAFLAYGLMKIGLKTPEIAFGDNLLINRFVSDLIRINKGFLVRRNLAAKDQLKESLKLSKYILYSLDKGRSIWLAQKGGRAKDGDDRTHPAILKMIYMSQVKGGMDFSQFINHCNIVPVAISYEYDPCDTIKAKETYLSRTAEGYTKNPHEDLISILRGINEPKGRVHYTITQPLKGEWKGPGEVAEAIDRAVITGYKLYPTNYIAYDIFNGTDKYADRYTEEDKSRFISRYKKISPEITRTVMEIYARPVMNKEDFGSEP